jgi:type IV fimbrial biogenesis protein FimT
MLSLMLMPLRRATRSRARGFSLIEVMVTVTLLGILLALAAPSFGEWIRNSQVRTVTDSLQNGLRLAQGEAVRRNRQVVFFMTNSQDCDNAITAAGGGPFWAIRTVPLTPVDPIFTVQCGVLSDVAAGVDISGPAALCFNSMGRQTANLNPGVGGATCALPATGRSNYDLSKTQSRPLRVVVALAGQLRLCDPARTLSSTSPDGCPV